MQEPPSPPRLHVLLTGASGLIGRALRAHLLEAGHTCVTLVRTPSPPPGSFAWNPATGQLDERACAGIQAVINLAGAPLGDGRWTRRRKRLILESRAGATRLLAETLARQPHRPAVLLSASAVGYYGDRGDTVLDEQSTPGHDFLAHVAAQWEEACRPAADVGIRVVHLRFGVVLDPRGGALARMLPPFRLGLGGVLGPGTQYLSWVSLPDAVSAVAHLLANPTLHGPFNIVAPHPVTNREFTRILGEAVQRPARLPAPAWLLRGLLGEAADALLLSSTRAWPARLTTAGFTFRHPELAGVLACLLAPPDARASP